MARELINITGQKFHRLTVLRKVGRDKFKFLLWECQCDCGNKTIVRGYHLRYNRTRSCGCLGSRYGNLRKENLQEHRSWSGMMQRCYNKKNQNYKYYGGRGIKVSERWRYFPNFLKDMGVRPDPKLTLDRINNNDNYQLDNCRWATRKIQAGNRRGYNSVPIYRSGISRQRNWQLHQITKGCCMICGQVIAVGNNLYCLKHWKYHNRKNRER